MFNPSPLAEPLSHRGPLPEELLAFRASPSFSHHPGILLWSFLPPVAGSPALCLPAPGPQPLLPALRPWLPLPLCSLCSCVLSPSPVRPARGTQEPRPALPAVLPALLLSWAPAPAQSPPPPRLPLPWDSSRPHCPGPDPQPPAMGGGFPSPVLASVLPLSSLRATCPSWPRPQPQPSPVPAVHLAERSPEAPVPQPITVLEGQAAPPSSAAPVFPALLVWTRPCLGSLVPALGST